METPALWSFMTKSCNSAFDDDDLITYYTHRASRRPLPFHYRMLDSLMTITILSPHLGPLHLHVHILLKFRAAQYIVNIVYRQNLILYCLKLQILKYRLRKIMPYVPGKNV